MSAHLTFNIVLPEAHGDPDPGYRFAPLLIALESLTRINQWHFKRGAVPGIVESGVVYQEEPPGKEDWDDAITVARRGWGDCEDLAAYMCAELREVYGVAAECVLKYRFIPADEMRAEGYPEDLIPNDGVYLVHVMVRTPDGQVFDPSKALGMQGEYH